MCGRFSLTIESSLILERFGIPIPEWHPRYNIAPSQPCPIVFMEDGIRKIAAMNWGLIPQWSKDKNHDYSMINARVETVQSKPSFKKLFQTRRCLVIADGFYEWKKTAEGKIPYRITLKSGEPFAFAGLWDEWRGEQGEGIKSFTILTMESNSLVNAIHDRMPIILKKENENLWLDLDSHQEQVKIEEALTPYPANEMRLYPVSSIVNSWKNDTVSCIQPSTL